MTKIVFLSLSMFFIVFATSDVFEKERIAMAYEIAGYENIKPLV